MALALLDALFLLIGGFYGLRVLKPMAKTYLSEIAFPRDFRVKLAACLLLFTTHGIQWLYDELLGGTWYVGGVDAMAGRRSSIVDLNVLFAGTEALVWGMATAILWMEYRRSMPPSAYLRMFWLVQWIAMLYGMLVFHSFSFKRLNEPPLVVVVDGVRFLTKTILAVCCFVPSTPITVDLVSFPTEVLTPSALLYSQNYQRQFTNLATYGSFCGPYEWAGGNGADKIIRDDPLTMRDDLERSASTRSSTAPAMLLVTIPSSTTSIWGKNQFVSYKIVVQTEDDTWTLRRHYNDFAALNDSLPDEVRDACELPRDDSAAAATASRAHARKFLSWKNRPRSMKSKLESYLRMVLSHPAFEASASQGMCDFLDMEYMEEALLRSFHSAPRV
uniref:PX domain-containing protein n=1 Tax=Globisporangium ultimum (strain ATCC 200006 / CBS 805.95 / DAOM BR144) TaxID=431595 RepID=K3X8R2_GLOUD